MIEAGSHLHSTMSAPMEEVSVAEIARHVARLFRARHRARAGGPRCREGPPRRCPDVSKLHALGFAPRIPHWRRSRRRPRVVLATLGVKQEPRLEWARFENPNRTAAGTGGSVLVDRCQVSGSRDLRSMLFLGSLPPVNTMTPIGTRPEEQPAYPAELRFCQRANSCNSGLSSIPRCCSRLTTRIRAARRGSYERTSLNSFTRPRDLFPIGRSRTSSSTSGRTMARCSGNFHRAGHRVCGIEPTEYSSSSPSDRGMPDNQRLLRARERGGGNRLHGPPIITATNVFAHIENVHDIVDSHPRRFSTTMESSSRSHTICPPLLETPCSTRPSIMST